MERSLRSLLHQPEKLPRDFFEPLQVVPITPSITAVPGMTNPGCEVEVTVLLREADYRPDDWLGLFKVFQYQSTKSITQRHVSKLHYARMTSNAEKFRKLTCRFYAPKHAGRYTFRYFHSLDTFSVMDSNEVVVTVAFLSPSPADPRLRPGRGGQVRGAKGRRPGHGLLQHQQSLLHLPVHRRPQRLEAS